MAEINSAVQCSAVQCSAVQCSAVQVKFEEDNSMVRSKGTLNDTVLYWSYCTGLHNLLSKSRFPELSGIRNAYELILTFMVI